MFFLVDPTVTITSTSDVPPQQPGTDTTPMSLKQAKAFREQLVDEHMFFVHEHNAELYERTFHLCEH